MVAILKLIISAALLSQVSALAISTLPTTGLQVDDPVLAVDTADVVDSVDTADVTDPTETDIVDADMERRAALPTSSLPITASTTASLPVNVPTGILEVGEPVLAVRPAGYTKKVRVTRATSTSVDTAVPTLPIIGKLIVGDPVLAVRPSKVVSKVTVQTTLATSTRTAVPTLSL